MRKWSLDQLSTKGVRPAELVEIAAFAGYKELCSYAKEAGVGVAIEFMGMSGLPGLNEALRWIDRVGVEVPTEAEINGRTAHIERTRDLLSRARSIASASCR